MNFVGVESMDEKVRLLWKESKLLSTEDLADIHLLVDLELSDRGYLFPSDEWMEEIERRTEEFDSGKVQSIPAEEVMRRLRERIDDKRSNEP
jgi:Putative addiction module component